jgi:alpha-pyrone synthase
MHRRQSCNEMAPALVFSIAQPMSTAYINRIGTAVPPFDGHQKFVDYAPALLSSKSARQLFHKMVERSQIEHRYSFLQPGQGSQDEGGFDIQGFYQRGRFPDTEARMRFYERHAPTLAVQALDDIDFCEFKDEVTHLIVASCTGLYAPGLDIDIVNHFDLGSEVERTIIGFMGCYSAFNAFKLARHIIRSEPDAKVIIVNDELCTIHMQDVDELERILCFSIWGDGCSACLVSGEPSGIELRSFHSKLIPHAADQMTWRIGQHGFDMTLSGQVPLTLLHGLPSNICSILGGRSTSDIDLWAVHPGGRSILDAVGSALDLEPEALNCSREVLRLYGNMSSATVPFVLRTMLDRNLKGLGCGMAFGPGLTAESMIFELAG